MDSSTWDKEFGSVLTETASALFTVVYRVMANLAVDNWSYLEPLSHLARTSKPWKNVD
jgi:hypothetical protein